MYHLLTQAHHDKAKLCLLLLGIDSLHFETSSQMLDVPKALGSLISKREGHMLFLAFLICSCHLELHAVEKEFSSLGVPLKSHEITKSPHDWSRASSSALGVVVPK